MTLQCTLRNYTFTTIVKSLCYPTTPNSFGRPERYTYSYSQLERDLQVINECTNGQQLQLTADDRMSDPESVFA